MKDLLQRILSAIEQLLDDHKANKARLVRVETRLSKLLVHSGLKADGSGPA